MEPLADQRMRRINQGAALLFLGLALYVVWEGRRLAYYTALGPGPGFFPVWLGGALAVLSLVWLAQVSRGPSEPLSPGFVPARAGLGRIGSILGALVVLTVALEPVGFRLTMLAFLLFLFTAIGRYRWWLTLALSLLGSFGTYYVFKTWLDVPLPSASIDLLQSLGL